MGKNNDYKKEKELMETLKHFPDKELIFYSDLGIKEDTAGVPGLIIVDEYAKVEDGTVELKYYREEDRKYEKKEEIRTRLKKQEGTRTDMELEELVTEEYNKYENDIDWTPCICVFVRNK